MLHLFSYMLTNNNIRVFPNICVKQLLQLCIIVYIAVSMK